MFVDKIRTSQCNCQDKLYALKTAEIFNW